LRYPHFESFYLMNQQGVQITSNIVNPAYRELISSEGRNVFRGTKPYFRVVIDSGHVLAADMNMKDFTQRSRHEATSVGVGR